MFLEMVKKRNPELIDYAVSLHQSGQILPDTYVIDLDKIKENASKMSIEAKKLDIELYFMLKQIGRNPIIANALIEAGIEKAVVVDFKEAKIMMDNHIPIGNVGHLVQLPDHFIKKVMTYGVDYITVYSVEKLRKINEIAEELDIKQKILLRVIDQGDAIYPGQYGGFLLEELEADMTEFKSFEFCDIVGVTSFPCILFNQETKAFEPSHNVITLEKAKHLLEENGFCISEMNVPSATSVKTLPLIKEIKGTQAEPGHALSGTSPMHAEFELEEKPAYVYVSEISHNSKDSSYIYGGGYYPRGNLENVLIDHKANRSETKVKPFPSENIDYYLEIKNRQPIGATAIMAFRTQIFVTRSHVAIVEGLNSGAPQLVGIYDSQGNQIERI
ncbi:YhfX family PLP-dependent enzyme [Marinilactibacillus psychrotolerans]|uniref:Amino acid racemase n=1 Tax=Marinilactibacillus psychrotolerans TaxID=191770 RepID=A0AAV3WXE8_9LACT|nr:YhfX family PLP-dependent enzyme [Marinilactibacillus psychrotolerans]GEL67627.1 amino-acid racemase [Marinilactibacillus psychrotolerans]GEQ35489.1 amino acid racemase [Marinilactibacillus psychrotolerans]SDD06841.1 Predicted amino acid racemase [Marinilactibacillus psychrotolerans]